MLLPNHPSTLRVLGKVSGAVLLILLLACISRLALGSGGRKNATGGRFFIRTSLRGLSKWWR